MAIAANHLSLHIADACASILAGYTESLKKDGQPFVLAENHPEMRKMALGELRNPVHFWQKLDEQGRSVKKVSPSAKKMLQASLPEKTVLNQIVWRQAGQGSLGRQRFVAVVEIFGGKIAREAKELAPSACHWIHGKGGDSKILYEKILKRAIRCPDPFLKIKDNWIIRRLAPDCSRINLSTLPEARDEKLLLYCMGWETANVHLGSHNKRKDILADLAKRHRRWLENATEIMSEQVQNDAKTWRKSYRA
jgi:hypothetical protein